MSTRPAPGAARPISAAARCAVPCRSAPPCVPHPHEALEPNIRYIIPGIGSPCVDQLIQPIFLLDTQDAKGLLGVGGWDAQLGEEQAQLTLALLSPGLEP